MAPAAAQGWFRHIAGTKALRLAYTLHARRRLTERGIGVEGIVRLLREGRVPRKPSRVDGLGRSKYTIEGPVSEDSPRVMRIVVIAAPRSPMVRVVTVMWVDEPPEPVEAPRQR
jgi:hypothetical protein